MPADPPSVIVLAGPNGAGKSTAAPYLLLDEYEVDEFVNADDIARGLSGFAPAEPAFAAGRIMLDRIAELSSQRSTFAFETTLSSRTFAPRLRALRAQGYKIRLIFMYLASADVAVERVRMRMSEGGHAVQEDVVRRRFHRGLRNLFELYLPLANQWIVYNNTSRSSSIIARSGRVMQPILWKRIQAEYAT